MLTERDLLDALWARLCRATVGGPPRYVLAEQVRHDPTYGNSIADAIAVDTWGSGHWSLEGYEVKTTRSDWRREIRGPKGLGKSLPWRQHCARWYVLAPAGVVPVHELPLGWGLIEAYGDDRATIRLRSRVKADNRPQDALPLPPRQVAGLMRATAQTAAAHQRRTTARCIPCARQGIDCERPHR